jgi:hypothetical protein
MSAQQPDLVRILAAGGKRADDVASVLCLLVLDGAQLGALEPRALLGADGKPELLPDGSPRTFKAIPVEWLDRLARAVEVGAFERLGVLEIVERILAPPLPYSISGEAES